VAAGSAFAFATNTPFKLTSQFEGSPPIVVICIAWTTATAFPETDNRSPFPLIEAFLALWGMADP